MEFVMIDSCTLITSSLFIEVEIKGKTFFLRQRKFKECEALFDLFAKHREELACIITRTVEIEATTALEKAAKKLLKIYYWKITDLQSKFNYSTLKNAIYDESLDRMEDIIDEYSTRPPMNREDVKRILRTEIEPFFMKIMPETCRYFPTPIIIKRMIGPLSEKKEILDGIKNTLGSDKIMYVTGEPKIKDKLIMAEATYICRVNKKKIVYVASLDYHFIPNPTQIDSFKSPLHFVNYENMDTRMRDLLNKNFGFFGARPKELLEIFETKMGLK
jgi:hypothetical protein